MENNLLVKRTKSLHSYVMADMPDVISEGYYSSATPDSAGYTSIVTRYIAVGIYIVFPWNGTAHYYRDQENNLLVKRTKSLHNHVMADMPDVTSEGYYSSATPEAGYTSIVTWYIPVGTYIVCLWNGTTHYYQVTENNLLGKRTKSLHNHGAAELKADILKGYQKDFDTVLETSLYDGVSAIHMFLQIIIREDLENQFSDNSLVRPVTSAAAASPISQHSGKVEHIESYRDNFFKDGLLQRHIVLLDEASIGETTFCNHSVNLCCLVRTNGSQDEKHIDNIFRYKTKQCLVNIDILDEWLYTSSVGRGKDSRHVLPNCATINGATALMTSCPWKVEFLPRNSLLGYRVLQIEGLDLDDIQNLKLKFKEALKPVSVTDHASLCEMFVEQIAEQEMEEVVQHPLLLFSKIESWGSRNHILHRSLTMNCAGMINSVLSHSDDKLSDKNKKLAERQSKQSLPGCFTEMKACSTYLALAVKTLVLKEKERSLVFIKKDFVDEVGEDRLDLCLKLGIVAVDVERRIPVVDSEEEMDCRYKRFIRNLMECLSEKPRDFESAKNSHRTMLQIHWTTKSIMYDQEREDKVESEVDGVPTYPPFLSTSASARNNTKESLCSEHRESSPKRTLLMLVNFLMCKSGEEVDRQMSKGSKIDLPTDCAWQACDVAKQDFDDDPQTMSDKVLREGQSSKSMSQSEGQLETVTITDKLPAHDIPYNDTLRKVSVEKFPEGIYLLPISMVRETFKKFLNAVLLPPKLYHISSIFGSAEFHRSLSMPRLFLEPLVEQEVATGIMMKELKFFMPKHTEEQYKLEKHYQKYFKRIEKTSLKPKLFSDFNMMENYEHLPSPSFENDVTNPLYVPAKMLLGSERIQGPLSPSIDTQEDEGYTYHLKLMENEDLSKDTETVGDLITGHSICLQDNEQESTLMPRTEIENVELDRKVALNRRTMDTDGLKPHVSHIRDNTWIPLEDLPRPTLDHVIVAPSPDSRIDMTLEEIFESIGQRLVPGPKTTMRYEFLRLCTMKTFPSINKPFIIRLVATGFYYASVRDELTCYCCGIRNSNWQATDNPEGIHRNRSPRCKFFLRNEEVNVRIPEPSGPQSDNLQRLEHLQQISSNPERATTSLPATAPERQLPTTEGTGHIAGGRAVRSPGAAGLHSDETVPTTTVQAKYPHYATKSARLESFKGWPQSLTQTPDIMAEAGFYFAGFGDCCRCFQCGVGLRHWDIDDNPWVEHCRWSSSCLYLKLKKGEEFVRLVQMAVTVTQEAPETLINRQLNGRSTLEEERSESGTPAPPQLSEVNTLLLTDAAQSVLEMGYQPKIIKQAIGKILQTKGRTGITAVALMEEVMELEEKEKQENATQNNSNNTVVLKSGGSTDQEEITLLVSDFSANTEGETNATASTDDSTLDSKAIKSENERLREQTLCKICLVNSICVVFLPCGHLVTCVDCAPAMRKCPMCRQIVKGTVRTYMG